MPVYLNMAAISATKFSSNALGSLDSVAHPLQPGQYRGEAFQGDVRIGTFIIEVAESGSGDQIEVDLCDIPKSMSETPVYRGGCIKGQPLYAVFHSDRGREGLSAVLYGANERKAVFDSRALASGDYFIVTPVRPGGWTMRSGKTAKGQLIVDPAKPGKQPRASAMGVMIKADGKSFTPANAKIPAGDGVAFAVEGRDVVISLELADGSGTFTKGRKKVGLRLAGPNPPPDFKSNGPTRAA